MGACELFDIFYICKKTSSKQTDNNINNNNNQKLISDEDKIKNNDKLIREERIKKPKCVGKLISKDNNSFDNENDKELITVIFRSKIISKFFFLKMII